MDIYIVPLNSYVHLSGRPDTMIELQTGFVWFPSFHFSSVPDTNLSAELYLIHHGWKLVRRGKENPVFKSLVLYHLSLNVIDLHKYHSGSHFIVQP